MGGPERNSRTYVEFFGVRVPYYGQPMRFYEVLEKSESPSGYKFAKIDVDVKLMEEWANTLDIAGFVDLLESYKRGNALKKEALVIVREGKEAVEKARTMRNSMIETYLAPPEEDSSVDNILKGYLDDQNIHPPSEKPAESVPVKRRSTPTSKGAYNNSSIRSRKPTDVFPSPYSVNHSSIPIERPEGQKNDGRVEYGASDEGGEVSIVPKPLLPDNRSEEEVAVDNGLDFIIDIIRRLGAGGDSKSEKTIPPPKGF